MVESRAFVFYASAPPQKTQQPRTSSTVNFICTMYRSSSSSLSIDNLQFDGPCGLPRSQVNRFVPWYGMAFSSTLSRATNEPSGRGKGPERAGAHSESVDRAVQFRPAACLHTRADFYAQDRNTVWAIVSSQQLVVVRGLAVKLFQAHGIRSTYYGVH